MTEQEFLTSTDPAAMLRHLRGEVSSLSEAVDLARRAASKPALASDRKLRLFACACSRLSGKHVDEQEEAGGLSYVDPIIWAQYSCRNRQEGDRSQAEKAALLREIIGNPYRKPVYDRCCGLRNHGAVIRIASTIYEGRRWEDMPILADALQDAWCEDAEILNHLRGPGPHARGCWTIDLLLGNS